MGDPVRNAMLESVIKIVEKDNLLKRTEVAGLALQNGLRELTVSRFNVFFPTLVHISFRPYRTFFRA